MAKKQVEETPESEVETTTEEEVYTGNVYEFNGGITISNNSGTINLTLNMQGIPNNWPPK